MTMVLEDARLALRLMRHNRGFTAATLLTLAAIGLRALKLKDPLHPELWICRGLIWGARDGDEIHLGDVVDGSGTGASPRRGCACF